ncbi:lipopolysaccharide assembly LapA domain-containing protein [Bacillus daqingensis]|uniref:Lipopolysaccharide assembly LapA domain-containing protein n=1 Tax=Bacillus daqingensis TaxID=872396 RepID=A0ABV9P1R5_9BACI
MKGQWGLIAGLIVILIIAIFAVINVDPVEVNFLFGQGDWPLVLVILASVLMGAVTAGLVGMYKIYQLQQEIKQLKQEREASDKDNQKRRKDRKKNDPPPAPEAGK